MGGLSVTIFCSFFVTVTCERNLRRKRAKSGEGHIEEQKTTRIEIALSRSVAHYK